jgi:hypothetical protein
MLPVDAKTLAVAAATQATSVASVAAAAGTHPDVLGSQQTMQH